MKIGEVSKASGIAPSAIRFYESSGILPKPRRVNGVRDYEEAILDDLQILRFLRSTGLSIRSLAADDRRAELERRIAELDSLIANAAAMKARLEGVLACRCNGDRHSCTIFA